MYVPSGNPKYTCKSCKRKIHIDDIENIFKEQLTEFILSKEEVNRYFDGTHSTIDDRENEIENSKKKIETLNKKVANLFELHEKGQIETERFKEFYDIPNDQINQLKIRIPQLGRRDWRTGCCNRIAPCSPTPRCATRIRACWRRACAPSTCSASRPQPPTSHPSCSAWRPGAARPSTSRIASSTKTHGIGCASSRRRRDLQPATGSSDNVIV